MHIPRFWAKAEQTVDWRGPQQLVVWQGSDISPQDAQRKAQQTLLERIARHGRGQPLGSYPGGIRPLREEVLGEIHDPLGRRTAVITRNAAGCLVLNTAKVMFIDLDFANQTLPFQLPSLGSLLQGFKNLFNPKPKPPSINTEAGLLEKVRQWHQQHPDWSLRVYRTRAGLRVLVAHDLFEPNSDLAQQTMKALGADGRYRYLCQVQDCFRARLTPKPWRMKGAKMERPIFRFPWQTPEQEADQRRWETLYQTRSQGFAVCRVLENLGQQPVHPEVEAILHLHDDYTLNPDKALA